MKQKLITMLELQNAMNLKVSENWREKNFEWYRAIWMEASEMLEHYGWKWWKKQTPDAMQVKLEVVDIVHFALSIRLQQAGNAEAETLSVIATEVAQQFEEVMKAEDIRKTIECLALLTLTDQGAHFNFIAGIMEYLDMPFDELYEIYVGKNVLNIFRQDNGYKEGHYRKIWDGREDNEHLADIIDTLDSNATSFKDDVYQALQSAYTKAA